MGRMLFTVLFLSLFLPAKEERAGKFLLPKKNPSNYTWSLEEDKEGIKVYTRSREGSSIKEFKGVITLEASLSQLVAILKDNSIVPKWMYRTSSGKLISQVNDWEWENYFQNYFPWPLGKRDMALHFKMSQGADKKIVLAMTCIPDAMKPVPDYTRIKDADGEITLTPLGNGKVEVTYQFFADPDTFVPSFLINALVTDTPYNTLLNLRELLKTHIHQDARYTYIRE